MNKGLKICGISDPKTLNYILNHPYPPKFIGFITNYKESKRYVAYDNLKNLINVNKRQSNFVSVLVNPTNEFLEKIKGLNFDYALETFKEIVAFHKGLLDKKKLGQNLGGQLEVDDFDLSQDAEYIIEEKKSELNFSNEKDDSIDGTIVFDDMPLDESNTTNDNDEIPESVFD